MSSAQVPGARREQEATSDQITEIPTRPSTSRGARVMPRCYRRNPASAKGQSGTTSTSERARGGGVSSPPVPSPTNVGEGTDCAERRSVHATDAGLDEHVAVAVHQRREEPDAHQLPYYPQHLARPRALQHRQHLAHGDLPRSRPRLTPLPQLHPRILGCPLLRNGFEGVLCA